MTKSVVMSDEAKKDYTIGSVERSVTIIEALKELERARVDELVDHLGISKSSVYTHLITLKRKGLVVQEKNKFHLSLRFLTIGQSARDLRGNSTTIKPYIREISDKTGMITTFMVEENGEGVLLYRESAEQPLETAKVGKYVALHATSAGKAILAHLSESKREQILEENTLPKLTENTISKVEQLKKELETVREQGYAVNRGERISKLWSIAVPILSDDQIYGAIAVVGPRHKVEEKIKNKNLPDYLLGKADEIQLDISY